MLVPASIEKNSTPSQLVQGRACSVLVSEDAFVDVVEHGPVSPGRAFLMLVSEQTEVIGAHCIQDDPE